MVPRNRRILAVALIGAMSCGGSDPISPPQQPPPPPPPSLVALRLTVPDSIVTGQPFTLSVASLDASGQPDGTWSGQVSLSSSAGTLEPSSITVSAGAGTTQATLRGRTGTVSFSAGSGAVQAIRAAFALSGAPVARLEIEPSAFLLPSAGSTVALVARAFDASGAPTTAQVTWETSNPGTVTVSAAGVATAVVGSGSTQVTAVSGSIRSQPALGLVTRPPQGAVLVADAQVVGSVTPVDPVAAYGLGWKYRVRLKGITPSVGQILIASGSAPLGGRVVAVTQAGAESDVTLELLPLGELLPELELHESIPLTEASVVETSPPAFRSPWAIARPPEVEFEAGAFKCKASTTAGQVILLPPTGSPAALEVESNFSYDIDWSDGFQRAVVHGSIVANLRASPRLTAALEGALECKFKAHEFIVPITGMLTLFIAGKVPVGVGFAFEGKVNFGDVGFDLDLSGGGTVAFGLDCTSECRLVSDFTNSAGGSFEPRFPTLGADFQVELGASGFVWAELGMGPPIEDVTFEALEVKLGLKQEAKLSTARVQANNPGYASEFRLAPFFKAGTAAKLQEFAALVGITVGELKFEPALDAIAQSPRGTLQVTPSRVNASRPGQPGDSATFTVTLNPVTYLTSYAVDDVQIFRKTPGGGGPFFLEPAGGACSRITPAATGQATFTCKTDFPLSMVGEQTFYAFVKPRMGGVLPLLLEVAPDSKAALVVDTTTIQVTKTTAFVRAALQDEAVTVCGHEVNSNEDSYTAPSQVCGTGGPSGTSVRSDLTYARADGPAFEWNIDGSVVARHEDRTPTPFGYSTLLIEFKVISGTVRYEVTGTIEATDAAPITAETFVDMTGPSGELFEDLVTGAPIRNVDRTGLLGPGTYKISMGSVELFHSPRTNAGRGEGRYTLTFRLTPVPAAVP